MTSRKISLCGLVIVSAVLATLATPPASFGQEAPSYFFVGLGYFDGGLFVREVSVLSGYPSEASDTGDYKYSVISRDGGELYSSRFDVPLTFVAEGQPQSQTDSANFSLSPPYFPEAAAIRVFGEDGSKVLEMDVSVFSPASREVGAQQSQSEDGAYVTLFTVIVVAGAVAAAIYFSLSKRKTKDPFESLKKRWA